MNHQLVPAFRVSVIESVLILFMSIHLNVILDNDKRFFRCAIILCYQLWSDSFHKTGKFRVARNNFNFSAIRNNSLKQSYY